MRGVCGGASDENYCKVIGRTTRAMCLILVKAKCTMPR